MREFVLNGLHIVLAAVLLLMAFVAHGRVPGMSADESAALGFLLFFGVGIPLVLVGLTTAMWSLLASGKRFVSLAVALIVTGVLVPLNVWVGIIGAGSYLAFAVWAFIERFRATGVGSDSITTS